MIKLESGNEFSTPIKGNKSAFLFDEIYPSTHSSQVSSLIQSLKKSAKMLKIESGNEAVTDGRQIDRRSLNTNF